MPWRHGLKSLLIILAVPALLLVAASVDAAPLLHAAAPLAHAAATHALAPGAGHTVAAQAAEAIRHAAFVADGAILSKMLAFLAAWLIVPGALAFVLGLYLQSRSPGAARKLMWMGAVLLFIQLAILLAGWWVLSSWLAAGVGVAVIAGVFSGHAGRRLQAEPVLERPDQVDAIAAGQRAASITVRAAETSP